MSSEAITWAKAQRCGSAPAKAVLTALACYADADGCAWAAVGTLLVETDLGSERTVQRALADLQRNGFLVKTGKDQTWRGKLVPIYRFALERGPANTRERLAADRAAREAEALGVTPVSPQDGEGEIWGDTGVTPRGDNGGALGVTPVSPKIEPISQDNPQGAPGRAAEGGGDDVASAFQRFVEAYPDRGAKRTDWPEARAAFGRALELASADDLVRAAGAYAADPDLKRTTHGAIGMARFLDGERWRGFLRSAEVAAPWPASDVAIALLARASRVFGGGFVASYLAPCGFEAAGHSKPGVLLPRTGFARGKLAEHAAWFAAEGYRIEGVG